MLKWKSLKDTHKAMKISIFNKPFLLEDGKYYKHYPFVKFLVYLLFYPILCFISLYIFIYIIDSLDDFPIFGIVIGLIFIFLIFYIFQFILAFFIPLKEVKIMQYDNL
jgi:hypothetical protein